MKDSAPPNHTYTSCLMTAYILYRKKPTLKKVVKTGYSLLRKKLPNFKYFENSLRHSCPPIIKTIVTCTVHKIVSTIQFCSFLVAIAILKTPILLQFIVISLHIFNRHYQLQSTHYVYSTVLQDTKKLQLQLGCTNKLTRKDTLRLICRQVYI